MTKDATEYFMFRLKNYHWKRNPELYKHVQYVLDCIFDDQKLFEESFTDSFEETITSSPDGILQFETNYLERNTKYDIFVKRSKDQDD